MGLQRFLNPAYLYGKRALFAPRIEMEFRRVRAQMGLRLTGNDRKLVGLRNINVGKRAFVIGNGPSLSIEDLDRLQGEITFAANKIWLAFDHTAWRPSYYAVEDDLVFCQNYSRIRDLKGPVKLFPTRMKSLMPRISDGIYFNLYWLPFWPSLPMFGSDPRRALFWGSTILFTHLQLARYMGIREVYLLGVDFSFGIPEAVENVNGQNRLVSQGEVNHFHSEYRTVGEKWNIPNLELQEKAFERARMEYEQVGGRLMNATRGGKLERLPRVDADRVLP